jgi:hypothetical protein
VGQNLQTAVVPKKKREEEEEIGGGKFTRII